MALPKKLKHFNMFGDGASWLGQAVEVKLPVLSRKLEEYRAAGMNGPISLDFGQEKLESEIKFGGVMRDVLNQYGVVGHNAVMLRFAGSYQSEDTAEIDAVEVVMRGRYAEIDMGTAKGGDENEFAVKAALSYYKLVINGVTVIEIDLVGMKEIVNGVDRLAEHRAAIGV